MRRTTLALTILGALLLSSLLAAQSALFQSMNLASGLVGWWKLCGDTSASSGCAASSGTAVYDSSGYGDNGTWSGTAAGSTGYYSAGNSQPWAGTFNGTNDTISCGTNLAALQFSSAQSFSVSAWVYLSSTISGWHTVFANSRNLSPYWGLWLNTGQTVNFNIGGTTLTTSSGISIGSWHHLVGVSTAGNAFRVYVDGSLAATGGVPPAATGAGACTIGGDSVSEYFSGRIQSVRVYNRALSAAEIAQMYLAHT
jgi:hypothetical protein